MTAKDLAIGLDFGTESVRCVVVSIRDGTVVGAGTSTYAHGVIDRELPGSGVPLPSDYAFQHPADWLESAGAACRQAISIGPIDASRVVGIGVDFTSCTMLPTLRDGTPLCLLPDLPNEPMAWPKLWKHHGAKAETDRVNSVARERAEPWLARYGNNIGLEWFFPKVLETLNHAPQVYERAGVWLEAGDWFVWQLVDGPFPDCSEQRLARSTCQAGYKASWNAQTGYPTAAFFAALHPQMANVVGEKMPGTLRSPGTSAGNLSTKSAALLGLPPGIPVSAAIIDAHAGLPGAGISEPDVMVLVMGTSSCHMLNSHHEALAPGIAGVVADGILPGYFGYETGQASVGDAFNWAAKTLQRSHAELNALAAKLPPGSGGILAMDWLNGCRTPLMDGRLSGAFVGVTLNTRPEQLYRALLEATAYGVRWIRDTLCEADVPVHRYVASGGLPGKSPLLMQIYADVLGASIDQAGGDEPCALGAAMLGAAAGGAGRVTAVIDSMRPKATRRTFSPDPSTAAAYSRLYDAYRTLANPSGDLAGVMRTLRKG